MGVDFSGTVLNAGQSTFGNAVTIDPIESQPGAVPYLARGVFAAREQLVQLDNGAVISSRLVTLSIRDAEFGTVPTRGDRVTLDSGAAYWVADTHADGQGKTELDLRQQL